jgi:hypothetical protein
MSLAFPVVGEYLGTTHLPVPVDFWVMITSKNGLLSEILTDPF